MLILEHGENPIRLTTSARDDALSLADGARHIAGRFASKEWWILVATSDDAALPLFSVGAVAGLAGPDDACEVVTVDVMIEEYRVMVHYRILFVRKAVVGAKALAGMLEACGAGRQFDPAGPRDVIMFTAAADRSELLPAVLDCLLKHGRGPSATAGPTPGA
jgi:hypothetical protein